MVEHFNRVMSFQGRYFAAEHIRNDLYRGSKKVLLTFDSVDGLIAFTGVDGSLSWRQTIRDLYVPGIRRIALDIIRHETNGRAK